MMSFNKNLDNARLSTSDCCYKSSSLHQINGAISRDVTVAATAADKYYRQFISCFVNCNRTYHPQIPLQIASSNLTLKNLLD